MTHTPRVAPAQSDDAVTLTDLGNAERFAADHSEDLRFVHAWGKWAAWDGARWATSDGHVEQAAQATAKNMVADAAAAFDPNDKSTKKALDHAIATCAEPRLVAMVRLARSMPEFAVPLQDLEQRPWLLNVLNGTVDLREAKLYPHCREHMITKLAPVRFDPQATAPTWQRFLRRAMGDDTELVSFLARLVGYTLTGVIAEHILAFHFGDGANGKSTFLGVLAQLLGDYGARAPRGLLFAARGERHPTELASLYGARFVACAEVGESDRLDEAVVKDLTGGDRIRARRMREDFWEFAPTHKLHLAGNHRPSVRGADEGIWRRIRLIPWAVQIPPGERDADLPQKLRQELPGILNWALEGCAEWQRTGLGEPSKVLAATSDYRQNADPLAEFLGRHVRFDDVGGTTVKRHLRECYEAWCADLGAEPVGAKRLAAALRARGVTETTSRLGTRVFEAWRGVRLATDHEREESCRGLQGANSGLTDRAGAQQNKPQKGPTTPYAPTDQAPDDDADERAAIQAEGAPC